MNLISIIYENKYFKIMEDKNYGNEEEIFRFSFSCCCSFTCNKCYMLQIIHNIQELINETLNHNVKVSGSVKNHRGIAPAGKIEVELPTTMSFTVDEDGQL